MSLEHEADTLTPEGCKGISLEGTAAFLEHPGAVDFQCAAVRSGKGAEYLEQGRFACPGRTGYRKDFPFRHLKVYPLQHLQGPEALMNVMSGDYQRITLPR